MRIGSESDAIRMRIGWLPWVRRTRGRAVLGSPPRVIRLAARRTSAIKHGRQLIERPPGMVEMDQAVGEPQGRSEAGLRGRPLLRPDPRHHGEGRVIVGQGARRGAAPRAPDQVQEGPEFHRPPSRDELGWGERLHRRREGWVGETVRHGTPAPAFRPARRREWGPGSAGGRWVHAQRASAGAPRPRRLRRGCRPRREA